MKLYYKTRQVVLQNAAAILLQNTTEVYYQMRQRFYYKQWQLNVKIITKCDDCITKCDSYSKTTFTPKCDDYYKMRCPD